MHLIEKPVKVGNFLVIAMFGCIGERRISAEFSVAVLKVNSPTFYMKNKSVIFFFKFIYPRDIAG